MNKRNGYLISAALAAGGLAVWVLITSLTGRREAWDSPVFWWFGVPAMLALNAAAGFMEPERIVMKGLVSVALQPAAMAVKTGEIGSMFPFGLIVFAALGTLYGIGGTVGALVKKEFFSPPGKAGGE